MVEAMRRLPGLFKEALEYLAVSSWRSRLYVAVALVAATAYLFWLYGLYNQPPRAADVSKMVSVSLPQSTRVTRLVYYDALFQEVFVKMTLDRADVTRMISAIPFAHEASRANDLGIAENINHRIPWWCHRLPNQFLALRWRQGGSPDQGDGLLEPRTACEGAFRYERPA